ncbi:MAG TPA: hypothetical protein VIG50_12395 [Vicinamibacteria bacterium]
MLTLRAASRGTLGGGAGAGVGRRPLHAADGRAGAGLAAVAAIAVRASSVLSSENATRTTRLVRRRKG